MKKYILCNENGVALLLVLGVVGILTFLLAEFTFDTKLNKIRIYNQQEKAQARLDAEAGLNYAMARLRLYQVGRNKIEKDENIKKMFSPEVLESFLTEPFVYPLPVSAKADIIQKSAINEFQKNALLQGEFTVTISKIAGFLNPNALRILPKTTQNPNTQGAGSSNQNEGIDANLDGIPDDEKNLTNIHDIVEKKLVTTLEKLIDEKRQSDDNFNAKYSNLNAKDLIKELKYFVNDRNKVTDVGTSDIENKFQSKNITPKHAPLSSIEELYLLPSWEDPIIDLIKDRMSVHEVGIIGVNEITNEDLKVLFPQITPIQIEEFFKSRDGDEEKKIKGKKFSDEPDFKARLTGDLKIVSVEDYDKLVKELKTAKMRFDVAGKLYKVISTGKMNSTSYKIVAYVDLPIKEPKVDPNKKTTEQQNGVEKKEDDGLDSAVTEPDKKTQEEEKKPPTLDLLPPRIVEIRLE